MTSRRDFFRSLQKPKREETPFYPSLPGWDEGLMNDLCLICDNPLCKTHCPQEIVTIVEGLPKLLITQQGCTLCMDCAQACPSERFIPPLTPKIEAHLHIDLLSCLAWNKTICSSCHDACNDRAILFTGLFHPEINPDRCTACGFCLTRCPTQAISFKSKDPV